MSNQKWECLVDCNVPAMVTITATTRDEAEYILENGPDGWDDWTFGIIDDWDVRLKNLRKVKI